MLARTPYIDRIRQAGCRKDGGRTMREGEEDLGSINEFRRNLMALILIMLNCLGNQSYRVWCRRLDIPSPK